MAELMAWMATPQALAAGVWYLGTGLAAMVLIEAAKVLASWLRRVREARR